MHNTGMPC
jgi:hypothetical protein